MDKNMINIDDLLQQRLGNAEEPLRAGAWDNMRSLLDKEMPEKKAPIAATNWRRMLVPVAGLVLLAAVSVGGYQTLQSFNNNGIADKTVAQNNTPSATTGLAGSAIDALPNTREEAYTGDESQPTDENTTTPASAASNTMATNSSTSSAANNISNQSNSLAANNTATTTQSYSSTQVGNTATATNSTQPSAPSTTNNAIAKNNSTNNNNNKTAPVLAATTTHKTTTTGNMPKTNANSNTTAKANTSSNTTTGNNATTTGVNKPANKMATNNTQPAEVAKTEEQYKEVPYQRIERKERVGKDGVVKSDTIFNGEDVMRIKQEQQLAMANNPSSKQAQANSAITPAAAAPKAKEAAAEEQTGMQKLSDNRVSRKKMKNYNPMRFEEMVQNAKFRMSTIKFYPGIVGGLSSTSHPNLGIYGGLAMNVTVGERWSILTEARFAHRFNGKKENIQDDYITNVRSVTRNGENVTLYDSMQHHYNFNSYQNIDIPVLVMYDVNRIKLMAGANFAYNLKINSIQEVDLIHKSERPGVSTGYGALSTDKKVLLSDFRPSMSIAPVLGIGYQTSPAWRLDLRLSMPLWNNASTEGQKIIADRLYNKPQAQFNINWRFGNNSNKPPRRR